MRSGITPVKTNDPTNFRLSDYAIAAVAGVVMDSAAIDSKLTIAALTNVTGVTIDYVSNGVARTGNATVTFTNAGTLLKFSEPSGSLGTGLDISTAGSYKIIDGTDSTAFIQVTSAGTGTIPTADKSDTVAVTAAADPVTTIRPGTVLGRITATGKYSQYVNSNTDGTEVARGILNDQVNMLNDAAGATDTPVVMAFGGYIDRTKLHGIDDAAETDLKHMIFSDQL